MPNKELGIADPIYDALRVRSGQSIAPDLGGGSTGAGGIENRIYVWHADGSTIDTFDPDAAGLVSALAAAVSGDTVWLPSIPIASTAGVTVPAGVTVVGISDNAALSFSGFSGAAITLSDGSSLIGFTVTMTSNGTTAIGVDATEQNTLVQHMTVTASGGSTLNIAVDTGVSISLVASEIWAGLQSKEIVWRSVGGSWQRITTMPDADNLVWFAITSDGATAYALSAGVKLYRCDNIKAATPIWTLILQAGDSAAGSTISEYFGYTFGPFVLMGANVYTVAHLASGSDHWAYGVYNGASWTWTRTPDYNVFSPQGAGNDTYSLRDSASRLFDSGQTLLESATGIVGYEFYRSLAGARYYTERLSGAAYLHRVGSGVVASLGASVSDEAVVTTKITGAEAGAQVYAVYSEDGHLWLSDDGSAFSDVATWLRGYARDELYNGGGTLIWIPLAVLSSATFCRRYARTGLSFTDLTDNLWSLTTGNKVIIGTGLVYA